MLELAVADGKVDPKEAMADNHGKSPWLLIGKYPSSYHLVI
jgi:hypothetical protein